MGIIIENLTFSYGDKQILSHINLSIRTGETIGIIGVSGGGKSTLLKLISGLYVVQSGIIAIDNSYTSSERRKCVSMVMQNAMLFPASIHDNITCGHNIDKSIIKHACDIACLTEWISKLPNGINTFVGERGGLVSGGQAQRIAIARAVVKNSPIVLLDEPTSALDESTGFSVITALTNLTKGKTVLHVSHQADMLADCDRILRLDGGQLYAL